MARNVPADPQDLDLAGFLPYRLSVLSNTISEKIAATYRREFGLSVPQWRVMAVVKRYPGISATAVSDKTAMDKVAVSRAVASLIDAERLERRARPEDGRSSALFLTPEGLAIYDQVAPKALDFERTLLAELSVEERETLARLLGTIARVVSPNRLLW